MSDYLEYTINAQLVMTLIDSHSFHTFAITLGTILFITIIFWAFWYASKMD